MTIAFVTGGNRGIGLASARRLARDCSQVFISSRDAAAGEDAVDRLRREGCAVTSVPMDVTDETSVKVAAGLVEERFGHVDILVNNAGILPEATNPQPVEIVDLQMFQRTFATNVFGVVAVLEAFLPLVRRSPAGRIVNVSTTMGSLAEQLNPESPYYPLVVPAYQSSKAALNSVTIALAKQLRDTPIKVTSVCPGFVRTGLAPAAQDAPLAPEDAAEVVHRAATLPDSAASGTFFDAQGAVPW